MDARVDYAWVPRINESFYEDALIERLQTEHHYEHRYGPDITRTSEKYDDVFIEDELHAALTRINPLLPIQAVEEAILKLHDIGGGSLAQRNERFMDYLQNGVEVRFFDGKEERDDIVYLLDFDDPGNNSFIAVNQWTEVSWVLFLGVCLDFSCFRCRVACPEF